jgi:hypothetical protein
LWGKKGLNAKAIHKEIFPIYGGECLSRKRFEGLAPLLPATLETRSVLSSAVTNKLSTPVTQEAWIFSLNLIALDLTLHVTV